MAIGGHIPFAPQHEGSMLMQNQIIGTEWHESWPQLDGHRLNLQVTATSSRGSPPLHALIWRKDITVGSKTYGRTNCCHEGFAALRASYHLQFSWQCYNFSTFNVRHEIEISPREFGLYSRSTGISTSIPRIPEKHSPCFPLPTKRSTCTLFVIATIALRWEPPSQKLPL